ncbi:MAG: ArsR family transcriptional regulator [Proteobacteria bacterium]|nr:ArsR family transcriptional regulator [Pseudomonadota bacterium]
MNEILQYLSLSTSGQKLDIEIAEATGISLTDVRFQLSELATKGKIMTCQLTRYENEKTFEGISCRIAGYIPPAAPGRKPKEQFNKGW